MSQIKSIANRPNGVFWQAVNSLPYSHVLSVAVLHHMRTPRPAFS